MTTIAICGEYFAADTQIEGDHVYQQHHKKIRTLRNGAIAGFAGEVIAGQHLLAWIEAGADRDDPPDYDCDSASAIVLYPNGKLYEFCGTESILVKPPFAVGSGAPYALGVMVYGGTAVDAVKAAMKLDSGTGGRIQTVRLK